MRTYNKDLEIQHIPLGERIATYWEGGTGNGFMLLEDEPDEYGKVWVVASFQNGYCNNASSFDNKYKAWDFFIDILKEVVEHEKSNPRPADDDDHSFDGLLTNDPD